MLDRHIRAIIREEFDKSFRGMMNAQTMTPASLGAVVSTSIFRIVDVPAILGSKGNALIVGDHVFLRLGLGGLVTLLQWSLGATVGAVPTASSVTVDVQLGNTLSTLASICGGALPALAAQIEQPDQPVTGWSPIVQIPDPQWMMLKATAVDGTVEVVGLTLRVRIDPRTNE